MKNIVTLLSVAFFVGGLTSCSKSSVAFMSHRSIVSQMNNSDTSDERESIDSSVMRRKANLVPLEDLFGKDFESMKRRKKLKKLKVQSSSLNKYRLGIDYRNRDTPIKNQWDGTCTAFGGVAGIENLLNKPNKIDLSERDAWGKYKVYSSNSFVEALSKKSNSICREIDWGQNETYPLDSCKINRRWHLKETNYLNDNIESSLDALDRGSVVYMGMSTPKDMLYCRSTIRPNSEFSSGGHALLIVGYKMDSSILGGGYFIVKNSWGADCGDFGYQYLPFHICERSDGYCSMWEFKSVVTDASDSTGEVVPPTQEPSFKWVEECVRKWYWLWLKRKCKWVKISL